MLNLSDTNMFSLTFAGTYLVVWMTMDRFMAIRFPIESQKWRQPKYALKVCTIVLLASIVYTSAYIHMATLVGVNTCVGKEAFMQYKAEVILTIFLKT